MWLVTTILNGVMVLEYFYIPSLLQLSASNTLALELDTGSTYSWSVSMATPKPVNLGALPVATSSPLPTGGSSTNDVCGGPLSSDSYLQTAGSGLPPVSVRVSRKKGTRRIHQLEQSKVL